MNHDNLLDLLNVFDFWAALIMSCPIEVAAPQRLRTFSSPSHGAVLCHNCIRYPQPPQPPLDIFDTIRYILNQDERYAALA